MSKAPPVEGSQEWLDLQKELAKQKDGITKKVASHPGKARTRGRRRPPTRRPAAAKRTAAAEMSSVWKAATVVAQKDVRSMEQKNADREKELIERQIRRKDAELRAEAKRMAEFSPPFDKLPNDRMDMVLQVHSAALTVLSS